MEAGPSGGSVTIFWPMIGMPAHLGSVPLPSGSLILFT
jgi:hypothetical protein